MSAPLPPEAPEGTEGRRLITDMKPGVDYKPNEEQLKELINERLKGSQWHLETQGAKPEQIGLTQILMFKDRRGQEAEEMYEDKEGEIKSRPRRLELTADIAKNHEAAQLLLAELLDT